MVQPLTKKIISQLGKKDLPTEDRIALVSALIDRLNAFPIGDMIHIIPNGVMINGKELDMEAMLSFREACSILKDNYARKIIHEQVRYKAIEMGIHKSNSIDEIMFSKAALWMLNELEILINNLSKES